MWIRENSEGAAEPRDNERGKTMRKRTLAAALALLLLTSCGGDGARTARWKHTEAPPGAEPVPCADAVIMDGVRVDVWESGGKKYVVRADAEAAAGGELQGDVLSAGGTEYMPCPEFAGANGFPVLTDPEDGTVYISPSAKEFEIPERVRVPVLMYHALEDEAWGFDTLFVRPSEFEEQLVCLLENGFDPIWFSDLSHVGDFDRPVILTFDDGYDNNCTVLLPILQKYNVKATVFLITGLVGKPRYLTAEQVRALSDSGLVSIQSHTVHHPELTELDREELEREFSDSRLQIARLTGRIPIAVSYPSGENSAYVRRTAGEYYRFGVKVNGLIWNTGSDPLRVKRLIVPRGLSISTFARVMDEIGAG